MGLQVNVLVHLVRVNNGRPNGEGLNQLSFYLECGYGIESVTRIRVDSTTRRLYFVLTRFQEVRLVARTRTMVVQSGGRLGDSAIGALVDDCRARFQVVETVELEVGGSTCAILYIMVRPAEAEPL